MTIKSSAISDTMADGLDLIVEFKGGRTYRFEGAAYLEPTLRGAPSVGGFFNSRIRGKFQSSRF